MYEVDITPTHYFKFSSPKHYDVVARVLVHKEDSGDNIDYKNKIVSEKQINYEEEEAEA